MFRDLVKRLEEDNQDLSFTQKGAIIEVITKAMLKFMLTFSQSLLLFRDNLYKGGKFRSRDITTIKKVRRDGKR